MSSTPEITIITICFNNLPELLETCQSVEMQTHLPFEHLIIDGSTQSDIKEYLENQSQPIYRRWVCEQDKGIADAFNKGVREAKGNIINFMNSGDAFYEDSVISKIQKLFEVEKDLQWLHGGYIVFRGGIWVTVGKPFEMKLLYRGMRQVSHQSMFVKKSLFDTYGYFSLNKKVAMDYDWIVRMAHEKSTYLKDILCKFAPGGASYQNIWQGLQEVRESYQKYRGRSIWQFFWLMRTYFLFVFTQRTWLGKKMFQLKNNK